MNEQNEQSFSQTEPQNPTAENQVAEAGNTPYQKPEFVLDNNAIMALLSYFGPLVLIPVLMKQTDPFIKFHNKQGLVIFGLLAASYILSGVVMSVPFLGFAIAGIFGFINLALAILSIIGIINVVQKQEKEIPLVGKFAKMIHI